ncbi:MAG: TRAP transporter permease [Alphaproteobacteria bacterium]|jgi:TRAP transporter 4TM/12TM fusion protein|nr:TRAP transporter permease [Alphaproteobacteria bacterium]MDP7228873.1 TRAP transporter permease [Alphaproteobacteria bacterium]MDP7461814.1 TRAP transporter permease [Alphaproteobacteria bacterium]HJM92863.1 TRAP transporter permease [Alphaproteobacteria bacterium]
MADAAIDFKKAEEFEERYDPEMQFRDTYALAKWIVIALLFLLSLFHYYTAGFGVLEHHWHVGVHLSFVLGLIYLVYTPHRITDAADQIAATARLSIRWPDLIKTGVPTVFVYGMMGALPAMGLFAYFILVVHFSRRYSSTRHASESATTDHVLLAVTALFALHMIGVATGVIDNNMWGDNGVPPAIRIGLAVMVQVLIIEAQRRIAIVLMFFAIAGYYYGDGIAGITWGLENNGLMLITTASVISFLVALEPVARGVMHPSGAEARALDSSRRGGVPSYDWFLFVVIGISSMYVAVTYDGFGGILDELNFRIGDPHLVDILMGTALVLIVIEAARRTSGISLPIITSLFIMYALFGIYFQYPLINPGTSWPGLIDHLYLKGEGINGRPVFVVATYVFHFVLFGMVAIRVGLGQLFIDLAHCVAGRFAGGPAKVSVLASGMMGMISGSSIANTVMTGSLTIPTMKRIGYKPHFAGAVEAAASTGGQITPPIMGSAAFLMVEFLEVPLKNVILAAIIPAAMHFLGVLIMVHFEAKRLGLRGLRDEELPKLAAVLSRRWLTVIPFFGIIYMIFVGYTPYWAAFWAISAALTMGFSRAFIGWVARTLLNIEEEKAVRYIGCDSINLRGFIDAFQMGGKYALSVGAAAATVGIIIGVLTVTGTPFNIAAMVNAFASDFGALISAVDPTGLLTVQSATLFMTLVLVACSCIIMGAGLPTTATYLVLATMATPALAVLGVDALQTHFFVFYYGVLADITPPVALAAYAGATIAQANLMQTGNTAFRLGAAKALVPFVFMYAPSMLLVLDNFTWEEFIIATGGSALGIVMLGAALTGYFVADMRPWHRWLLGGAAILVVAPGLQSGIIGLVMALPVVFLQLTARKRLSSRSL